jgi:hypothetical protein
VFFVKINNGIVLGDDMLAKALVIDSLLCKGNEKLAMLGISNFDDEPNK